MLLLRAVCPAWLTQHNHSWKAASGKTLIGITKCSLVPALMVTGNAEQRACADLLIKSMKGGCAMIGTGAEYLMVEDNVCDAEIALFDFEEHGIAENFHVVRNGAEALNYLFAEDGSLRVEPPKAIFLDLHMPKINGLEFLHTIKSDARTKEIPVVVLESSPSPSELSECQRLGVNSFVRKPLEYEDVINVIKNFDA